MYVIFSIYFFQNKNYSFRCIYNFISLESVIYFPPENIKLNVNFFFNRCMQLHSYHSRIIVLNLITFLVSWISSHPIFKSSDVAKSPMSLGKITWFIFLINSLFVRTNFLNSESKNIFLWFSGRTDLFRFVYLLYLDTFIPNIFCGCSRSCLILFYFWMFDSTFLLLA